MKASIALSIAGAALALAGPIKKKDTVVVEEIEVQVVYTTVYVTGGSASSTSMMADVDTHSHFILSTSSSTTTTTTTTTSTTTTTTSTTTSTQPPAQVTTQPVPASNPAPQAQPAAAQAQAPSSGSYQDMLLYHHNAHRSNCSAGALTWDNDLANAAAQLVQGCVWAHNTAIPAGSMTGYGQNLDQYGASPIPAGLTDTTAGAYGISDGWFTEYTSYPFGETDSDSSFMNNFEAFGHFSQLVWKGSSSVGCATYLCPSGSLGSMDIFYTACNYWPAGNVVGSFAENVAAPGNAAVLSVSF